MLVSAEWPIYGRYGYGVATEACMVELDLAGRRVLAAAWRGHLELVGQRLPRGRSPHLPADGGGDPRPHELGRPVLRDVVRRARGLGRPRREQRRPAGSSGTTTRATPQGAATYTVKEAGSTTGPGPP